MLLKLIIFLFGLCIGSFLNCVIYRMEKKKSLRGRSFCPKCKHKLGFLDLIPVFSYVLLRARCRYCNKPISIQYTLIELITGLLFVLLLTDIITSVYLFFVFSVFIIIFVYDLKHYLIPDKLVYFTIFIVFIYQLLFSEIYNPVLSAIGAGLFFFILWAISKGKWMGAGDIGLAALIGLFLGFPNIVTALFSSFIIGAIIGVVLIILNKKGIKSQVPFGPFLIIGTFIALFFNDSLINLWLKGLL